MPQNKRESLIYTVLMCFVMVFWMSMYNVALHMGSPSLYVLREGWLGFPIAYIYAMCFDWFLVSKLAKGFAFRFLVKPESSTLRKVIVMSLYGGLEMCVRTGEWGQLGMIWLTNIPKNFIMALPFQLLIAGPIVRKVFRSAFPVGSVQ